MKSRLQNRFSRVDAAALLVFFAVWFYYVFMVRYGFSTSDESFYVSIAQRFAQGDRPLVDEWAQPQFSCLFLCLPYKLFVSLTGGTDGVILCLRYLFLAFNAAFYWIMYIRLRAYRWIALIATLLFCFYVPFTFFTINYYTAAVRLLMIVCLILFAEKQPRALLVLAGVLLACSVLFQPGFALLYCGFSALTLIRSLRRKKGKPFPDEYGFCLHARAWKHLSLGVLLCAAVFLFWLLSRSGLRDMLTALSNSFSDDPEYNLGGSVFKNIADSVKIYGPVCALCALLIVALSIAYACGAFRSRRGAARNLLFWASGAVWIWCCVPIFRGINDSTPNVVFTVYPAPLMWFGLVCFLLCAKKNKRLFFFWIVGLASSLCVDVLSNSALSIGCPISYVADLAFFVDLVRELRADPAESAIAVFHRNPKRAKRDRLFNRWFPRLLGACFAVWFSLTFLFENTAFPEHYIFKTPLFSLPVVCETGPCRSLHCSEKYGKRYGDRIADVDALKQKQPENLFVYGEAPEVYLYADLRFATCSPWTRNDASDLSRQIRYWTLHPERLPECVYVPYEKTSRSIAEDDAFISGELDRVRNDFDPICEYTAEPGQAGVILYVSRWKTADNATIN